MGVPVTFIKDPGNQTESYLDGAVRNWRDTAGLWRAAARDLAGTVNGRATPGWSSGQLWSLTASQWEQNSLGNLNAYNDMVNQRNTWITNANTAYDSGTWGTGTHWHTRYDQQVVVTNAKTTTSASQAQQAFPVDMDNNAVWTQVGSLAAPRSGQAHASAMYRVGHSGSGNTTSTARIKVAGGVVATGNASGTDGGGALGTAAVHWTGAITSGQVVTVELTGDNNADANNDGSFALTVGNT